MARWLIEHSVQAATLSIEEIARASNCSPATVNRVARKAGYGGFSDLKADLVRALHNAVDPVRKLRDDSHPDNSSLFFRGVAYAQANLKMLSRSENCPDLGQAVDCIRGSECIYVLGMGMSSHLAAFFVDSILPFHRQTVALAGAGGSEQCYRRLCGITDRDMLLAVTLPRYSRHTVEIAAYAKERGATLIGVSDSRASPLLGYADLALCTPAAHPVLSSSYTATLALLEGLVTEVIHGTPDALTISAELTDSVLPYLTFPTPRTTPKGGVS